MTEPARHLLPAVYEELRAIARHRMRGERAQHTLQPTALVHEAYLRLAAADPSSWRDEREFKVLAARAMRQVLVDHARRRGAIKRGGDRIRVTLDTSADSGDLQSADFVALDEALKRLAALNERQAAVVELRFFGGLAADEIAEELAISPRTVGSEWRFARAWLVTYLG